MRVQRVQVWPEFRKQLPTPTLTALREVRVVRITFAHLPPSSSATRLTVAAPSSRDARAGARRAGERDHVDVRVRRRSPHRPTGPYAGDEVEDAGRQADLVDGVGEDERAQRRDLARLQHDGAAGGERRRDLRGDLVQRVVPRRDRADDADRLAHDESSCRPAPPRRSASQGRLRWR